MKSFFAPLAVVACLATSVYSQTFTINSLLNVVVCLPSLITWTGGQPPYFLSILPANQPSAAALVDLGQQNGDSVTWLANLPVGTGAFLNLRDSTGALAQSGTFTVLAGGNTSCVGQTLSASSGPAATTVISQTTAASPVGSSAPGSGAPGSSAPGSSAPAATTGKSSSTPSGSAASTSPSSAAISKYAGAGVAAIFGSALLSLVV